MFPQSAHLAHILFVVDRMNDGARSQKQKRLEKGMGKEMEHASRIGTHAKGYEHVSQLRAG